MTNVQRMVSTENVPQIDRFSYWCDAVTDIGVPGERDRPSEAPFEGQLLAAIGVSLTRFRFRSAKYRVSRPSAQAARRNGDDRIWLYREIGEGSCHEDNGLQFVTRSGDVIIGNPTLPLATEALGDYDHEIWHFPRTLLEPHLPAALRPRLLRASDREGVNGILGSYLDALAGQVNSLGDTEAAMVADNFCRLVAIACGSDAAGHPQAIRAARLEELKRYIGLHLSEPGLSPAKAAAALKISVRQVHLLFEPTGMSFAEYVLRQRLEECRAALTSATGRARSVTDIAFAWGFNSLSTFYRTFVTAFAATPSELREEARRSR